MTSLPTIQKLSKLGKVLSNLAFIFSKELLRLGIMFLLGSLLCRYGAELRGNTEPDKI